MPDDEHLYAMWRQATQLAGQPQTVYPQLLTLRRFYDLVEEEVGPPADWAR